MGDLTEAMGINTTYISHLHMGGDIATLPPMTFVVVGLVDIVGSCVGNTMIILAITTKRLYPDSDVTFVKNMYLLYLYFHKS